MKTVNGEQIAFTENGGIWAEFQELTEFQFMNITVIGKQNSRLMMDAN